MKKQVQKSVELDQYYTKEEVAEKCLLTLVDVLGKEINQCSFILEPSAGTGTFIESAKCMFGEMEIKAFDIDPKHSDIEKADFLSINTSEWKNGLTIGNPPFGKRALLAIDFFNKAAEFSEIIAFIVPVQFQKWSVQSKLNKDFSLIFDERIQENAFVFNNKDFNARCCFQIWVKHNYKQNKNLRIIEKPKTQHKDFEMYQYNNTKEARKYFDYDWDFCVPRQGFYDYNTRIFSKGDCKLNVQYMFIKYKSPIAKEVFDLFDFENLAKKNTTIPGFGKADVVYEYERLLKDIKDNRKRGIEDE